MIAIIASEIISADRLSRLSFLVMKYAVTSRKRLISKPPRLIIDSSRVTIVPASSFAFAKLAPRKTPNSAGATAAPKKIAAPSHRPSSSNRNTLTISVILIIQSRNQANHRRLDFRLRELARIRNTQQPGQRSIKLRLIFFEVERHEDPAIEARELFFGGQVHLPRGTGPANLQ